MRKLFLTTLFALFVVGTTSFAGETYESEEARFRVTFPTDYEVETDENDGTKTISLTCIYGDAIIIGNVYIYEEEIPEDDNLLEEAAAVIRICDAFEVKYGKKFKKLFSWDVGDEQGLGHPLNTKLEGSKYYGNYYVVIVGNIQYQFTYLAGSKKYDTSIETRFINSFTFL